jgi:hypothetical protein
MATQQPPATPPGTPPDGEDTKGKDPTVVKEVELLRILITREGKQVNASWAVHPQMKHDLLPQEWKEVSDLMAKATNIVGARFAQILSEAEPDKPGNA